MSKNTGGPAFPSEGGHKFAVGNDVRKTLPSQGMSLRDYFAAKALQSLIIRDGCTTGYAKNISEASFVYADAMLRARGDQ